MARRGLEDLHILPMPELKGPTWIVGTTPPVHRVRYWLWTRLYRSLDRIGDRVQGVARAADVRATASGPQPIIDESKLPTSGRWAWSTFTPEPHRFVRVERDS